MSNSNDLHDASSAGAGKCPFNHGQSTDIAGEGTSNQDWWPHQLRVDANED